MAIEKIKILGADYSFELILIETYAPQFIGHNKVFLGSVCLNGCFFQSLKLLNLA